ncbi:aminotransferase class IV, partial [Lutimonas sp.]|uniref:aminotransferase class IV n=1 Tax=Lutimonas sp. TaxID=1872403 RepID=UPI003D9B245E
MVNQNGNIIKSDEIRLDQQNRAFKYGDGIFDTLKFENGSINFIEDHYFRLMSSMRMLRMKIPMDFTLEYYIKQIKLTLMANDLNDSGRIRVDVFRKSGGLYTPETNEIEYVIQVGEIRD